MAGLYLQSSCITGSIAERDEMKLKKMLTLGVAAAALFALCHLAVAQAQDSQTGSQGGGNSANPANCGAGRQRGDARDSSAARLGGAETRHSGNSRRPKF